MNILPYSGFPALPKNIEDMHNQLVTLGLNDVEALTARIKKCEDWVDTVEETELTGNPVEFQNALAVPAKSLVTTINAIQDLHGYDHPWAGGAGKNKWSLGDITTTETDIPFSVAAGTYTLSANVSAVGTTIIAVRFFYGETSDVATLSQATNYKATLTFTDAVTKVNVSATNGTATNVQLEEGSTKTDFAPYSNICPISGRTAAVVNRSDGDEISEDFTIQLGTTVYGADINWDTGVMTVTDAIVSDMGALNWNRNTSEYAYPYFYVNIADRKTGPASPLASSIFKNGTQRSELNDNEIAPYNLSTSNAIAVRADQYTDVASFKTAVTGQTVCYKLATPTTIQLTPTQLEMLKGYNRVSSEDADSLTVTAYTGGPWEPITRATKKKAKTKKSKKGGN